MAEATMIARIVHPRTICVSVSRIGATVETAALLGRTNSINDCASFRIVCGMATALPLVMVLESENLARMVARSETVISVLTRPIAMAIEARTLAIAPIWETEKAGQTVLAANAATITEETKTAEIMTVGIVTVQMMIAEMVTAEMVTAPAVVMARGWETVMGTVLAVVVMEIAMDVGFPGISMIYVIGCEMAIWIATSCVTALNVFATSFRGVAMAREAGMIDSTTGIVADQGPTLGDAHRDAATLTAIGTIRF
ncbi:hypothetical protein GYB59_23235 [bacterium]|nr:hypothetical protein [bacterium]